MHEHMVTMDPPEHTRERAMLMRLLTPGASRTTRRSCGGSPTSSSTSSSPTAAASSSRAYTQPFAMLVVADVLGVPEEDHQRFREGFGLGGRSGTVGAGAEGHRRREPAVLARRVSSPSYIEDRRREPREDVLTKLALATYPDGTMPPVIVGRAHRDLPVRRRPGDHRPPARRRDEAPRRAPRDPGRSCGPTARCIPNFLEEVLRIESPVKTDFRLARRTTTVGGVDIKAGTPVMLLNGAANRDPRRFECPAEFRIDRPNAEAHMAFGRGAHSCPGGPLARVEGRVSLERILDRMRRHPPLRGAPRPGRRPQLRYEPTWVLRGLTKLHLEFEPAGGSATVL